MSTSSAGRVCWLIQCVSPCFRVARRSDNGSFLPSVALLQLARGPHIFFRDLAVVGVSVSLVACGRQRLSVRLLVVWRLSKGSGLLVKSFASAICCLSAPSWGLRVLCGKYRRCSKLCPFACETCPD